MVKMKEKYLKTKYRLAGMLLNLMLCSISNLKYIKT